MDFSNLTKFWKAKFLLVFVFSLFYSADLMAQSELRFERVVNLTRTNPSCISWPLIYSPMIFDTVPVGKIWKLEAVSASCLYQRRPLVSLNGVQVSLTENSRDATVRVYSGNPIWLKESTIIGSFSDNPNGQSGCHDCNYFYSILEFSQTP
jgi:hypothetical protein